MKLVFLFLLLVVGTHAVFIEEPSSAVVVENDTAVFRCRVNISYALVWVVNVSSTMNPDILRDIIDPASDGGPPVNTLSIVGRCAYNGTTVVCHVFSVSDGSSSFSLATLQIQGLLAAVSELSATPLAGSNLFSWAAPFSLNLTNTEPDITYCVDVLSSGGTGLVAGGCGLNETQYSFSADVRSPCDSFTAVVTPVNGAGNGTASQPVTGTLFAAVVVPSVPGVTVRFPIQPLRTFNVSVDFGLVVYACNYAVNIESNDGPTLQPVNIMMPVDKTIEGQTLTLTLNTSAVPLNRNYLLEIFLENSAGNATTLPVRLSTHDVQDLRTPMPSSGDDELIIVFAENSNALGCLVIVAGSGLEMFYIGHLDNGTLTTDPGMLKDTLPTAGLPEGSYEVAVYDVERDSMLPGTHTADTAELVIERSQASTDSDAEISEGFLVIPNDDREICVNCTIPADVSATECVVITHPAGSLDEIKTFLVLNDTVGCEPVPTSQAYYVATFGRLDNRIVSLTNQQTPTDNVPSGGGTAVIIAVVVALVVVLAVVGATVLAVVVVRIFVRHKKTTGRIEPGSTAYCKDKKPSKPNADMRDKAKLLVADCESQPPPPTYDSVIAMESAAEASGGPPPPPPRSETPPTLEGPPLPPRSETPPTLKGPPLPPRSETPPTLKGPPLPPRSETPPTLKGPPLPPRSETPPTLEGPPLPPRSETPPPPLCSGGPPPPPPPPSRDPPPPPPPPSRDPPPPPSSRVPLPKLCTTDAHDNDTCAVLERQCNVESDYNSPTTSEESFDLQPRKSEPLQDTAGLQVKNASSMPEELCSCDSNSTSVATPGSSVEVPPSNSEPVYDIVKRVDKKVSDVKATAESNYANTEPSTKLIPPPKQDTEVLYDEPAGFKSDGKTYAIPNVKPPKDDKERPADKNAVAYGTIDHLATAKSKPKREATAVPAAVPALSAPTKDLLCERLYKVKEKWMDLGKQFKQDEDRLDRIFTSDEENEACLLGVIEYWLMNGDFEHTWSEVVTALEAIGEHILAQKIQKECILPDMPNLPGIPIHEHSQADSCHTAVDMEGAAKAAAEHIVVEVEQDVSPTETNGSDHADEEDTYQTSGGERFSSEGLCDNSIHEHSIDCEYPKQEVTSKTNGDDKVDRKVGDIVGVGSPQKMVQAPRITVTRGECIDYNDDSKCNHPIQDCKESFDDKRNCLFSHEVYLLWRNVSNKSGKQAQHDRNLGPKEVSRCLYYSEEAELNLVPHASSQPESDEEEGKITLDSSPALELLNHAKEMSIVGREHILSANFEMVPVEEKDEFADDLSTADEATGNTHCVPHTNGFATREHKAGRKTSIAHFSNRGSINGRGSLCSG